MCRWSREELDDLLDPLQAHVDAATRVRDRCREAMQAIDREWGLEGTAFKQAGEIANQADNMTAAVIEEKDKEFNSPKIGRSDNCVQLHWR